MPLKLFGDGGRRPRTPFMEHVQSSEEISVSVAARAGAAGRLDVDVSGGNGKAVAGAGVDDRDRHPILAGRGVAVAAAHVERVRHGALDPAVAEIGAIYLGSSLRQINQFATGSTRKRGHNRMCGVA